MMTIRRKNRGGFGNIFIFQPRYSVRPSFSSADRSGNLDLVTALSKWAFKEVGVLRVKKVEHHLAGNRDVPREYTIMQEVVRSS